MITLVRGDAAHLPLPDSSVDLIVTSPPYFALRSYQDQGGHYAGQIGSEATPTEFIDALIACTREWVRVLKPSGSLWVNLGDKYGRGTRTTVSGSNSKNGYADPGRVIPTGNDKSLMGLPWRYALRCIDDLGLILRAEVVWSKPNGLPESVTDRVRRSHEQWFHLTKQPRYYAAVDTIREPQTGTSHGGGLPKPRGIDGVTHLTNNGKPHRVEDFNPLGKLPGSVWSIPSQPLTVPAALGVDHFAAFPMELPRRIILGWSPSGICTRCGEGRRPVVDSQRPAYPTAYQVNLNRIQRERNSATGGVSATNGIPAVPRAIIGDACACTPYTDHPGAGEATNRRDYDPSGRGNHQQGDYGRKQAGEYERVGPWREYHEWTPPPTRPAVVLDPFGGTGTVALMADVLGRHGISVDMSADYCRLAQWRTTDPGERARAMQVDKPEAVADGQMQLFA